MKQVAFLVILLVAGAAVVMTPLLLAKRKRGLAGRGVAWSEGALTGTKKKVNVQIVAVGTCDFGDLDAIDMDLALDTQTPLQLFLEPAAGGEAVSVPIDRRLLEQTGTFEAQLKIPASLENKPAVLALCRDKQGAGSCSGKEALSPTDLIVQNSIAMGEGKPLPPDRVYWLSPFTVGEGRVHFAGLEPAPKNEKGWEGLVRQDTRMAGIDNGSITNLVKRLALLRPLSAHWQSGGVEIPLSFRDKSLCKTK